MKKAILITLTVLAVIAIGGYFYLKTRKLSDFQPAIKDKLQSLIIKATDSLYHLEFDTLDADILKSKITVVNARLVPDSTVAARLEAEGRRPENIFSIQLDTLEVAGIDLNDFTRNKKIDLDTLYINAPKIEIFHKKPASTPKDSITIESLYQKLASQLNRLSVKKLYISNMRMVHHNLQPFRKEKNISLENINIYLQDILMDSTTVADTTRFMFAKQATVTMVKLKLPTADSLYYLKLDTLSINAVNNSARLQHFSLKSRYSRDGFVKQVPYQKDLYDIDISTIKIHNIKWGHVLTGEELAADTISAQDGNVSIFCDRGLAKPPSKMGHYPHQLLMKDSLPIKINHFILGGFTINYSEYNPKSDKTGKLEFKNTYGTVTNITNNRSLVASDNYMRASVTAMFMGETKVKATFLFNLSRAKEGAFTTDANMEGMDATHLNDLCAALGRFNIDKGHINSLTTHIEGDNYGAKGTVTFLYNDLKISVLKKDDGSATGLKKRGLLSFIANAFVIKNDNPTKGRGARTESSSFTRNPSKSFFNLVWKTVEDGVKKTAGYK